MSIYRERRTVKPFDMDAGKAVSREMLEEILEDACWAPTHGLTQPWRFHVFATPAARGRLADALLSLYDQAVPEAERDAEKRAKLGNSPTLAPVVIALAAKIEPEGKVPEWEEMAAVSCAAQNLMLSAHEKGLGTFWSSPPVTCSREFVSWLGLGETHRAMGLLYLGWPREDAPVSRSVRLPLDQRAT